MFKGILFCVVMVLIASAVVAALPTSSNSSEQEREAGFGYRFLLNVATVPLMIFGLGAFIAGLFGSGMGLWMLIGAASFALAIYLGKSVIPRLAGKEPWAP